MRYDSVMFMYHKLYLLISKGNGTGEIALGIRQVRKMSVSAGEENVTRRMNVLNARVTATLSKNEKQELFLILLFSVVSAY